MPIWAVDKNLSGFSVRCKAAFAFRSPLLPMLSSLPFLALTNAISLITNKEFKKISSSKIKISILRVLLKYDFFWLLLFATSNFNLAKFYFILMSANFSTTVALFSGLMNVKDSLVTG